MLQKMIVVFSLSTVSIQLVSPASGELSIPELTTITPKICQVSIQLVSPASGESLKISSHGSSFKVISFHSISFPSEWGAAVVSEQAEPASFPLVSIQLVSPASGEF